MVLCLKIKNGLASKFLAKSDENRGLFKILPTENIFVQRNLLLHSLTAKEKVKVIKSVCVKIVSHKSRTSFH